MYPPVARCPHCCHRISLFISVYLPTLFLSLAVLIFFFSIFVFLSIQFLCLYVSLSLSLYLYIISLQYFHRGRRTDTRAWFYSGCCGRRELGPPTTTAVITEFNPVTSNYQPLKLIPTGHSSWEQWGTMEHTLPDNSTKCMVCITMYNTPRTNYANL